MTTRAADIVATDIQVSVKIPATTSRAIHLPRQCEVSLAKIQTSLSITIAKYISSSEIHLGFAKALEVNSKVIGEDEATAQIALRPITIEIIESETVIETMRRVQVQSDGLGSSASRHALNGTHPKGKSATLHNFDAVLVEHGDAVEFANNSEAGLWKYHDDTALFSPFSIHFLPKESEMNVLVRCYSKMSPLHGILETFLDVWQHILIQVCDDRSQKLVSQLDYVPSTHMETLLRWNSDVPNSVERTIHELIRDTAVSQPDAPAIYSWDETLTYKQLETLSTSLAHHLANLSIGPQSFVALCFDKSVWPTVCMLAILKAGGAFVPVDPAHPVDRKMKILEAAGASTVLTNPQYVHLFSDMDIAVIEIDKIIVQATEAVNHATSLPSVDPASPMLIVNTSGSTGYPKSIIIQHNGLASTIPGLAESSSITAKSRVLQFSAYSFDGYIYETFTTLVSGGCVCVPSEEERVNDLAGAIVRMGVTTLIMTPSVARLLSPRDVPCVRGLTVGGEPYSKDLLERWAGHVVMTNSYGPAECIVACTFKKSLRADDQLNNIGKPLRSAIWIVDPLDHDILSPIGSIGELLVGGPGLARGYTDSDLTHVSFIESPQWASEFHNIGQYTKFYKTGDLVKYNLEGDLVYIGRKDSQVKVHGQRLELGEAEHHLAACDLVQRAVVHFPSEGVYKSQLVAVVTLDDVGGVASNSQPLNLITGPAKAIASIKIQKVRDTLSQVLPSYMVPQTWLVVESIPLTTSGKLDRLQVKQFLLEQDVFINYHVSGGQAGQSSIALTETEKALSSLWSEVLDLPVESIDTGSNFLELGGNSLKAMRLVSFARRKKIRITLASIFQDPVLAAMASRVETVKTQVKAKRVVDGTKDYPVPEAQAFGLVGGKEAAQAIFTTEAHLLQHVLSWVDVQDMYPCTPLQAGLIALSAKYPGAYTIQNVWELPQTIDVNRFKAAWKACFRDIAILRTMILPSADHGPCQVVLKPDSIPRSNLWQRKARGQSLNGYLQRDSSDAISYGSLLNRVAFVQNDKYCVWTCHHSAYDAVSMVLVLQAVEQRYHGGISRSLRAQVDAPSMASLIRHIHNTDPQASQGYWQSYLSGAAPAKFPQILAAHEPRADARLRAQARLLRPSAKHSKSSIVPATIIRAAWALVLGRYSETLDIVFGVTLGGRTADVADIDKIVGPTATTLPVRVLIDPQETVRAYLERVQSESTAMIDFEHVGIPKIAAIGPEYRAACDFNSLLVIQAPGTNAVAELLGMLRLDLSSENDTEGARSDVPSYALSVDAELGDSVINITVTYDSQLIPSPQISRMADQLVHVIEQLSVGATGSAGDGSVGDIDLVTEQDVAQLAIWNKTMPPARDTTVTAEMAHWVAHNQTAPAVCAWDAELTYGELDKAADRMARMLTGMGVGASDTVPICFDKSAWVVVAVLGILRAGAAYVALDPSHPQNRLEGIISDVDATVIVSAPQHADRYSKLQDVRVVSYSESFIASLIGTETDINTTRAHLTPSPPSPTSPAFILFSSGTTGRPKGIVVEHNAVCTSTNAFGSAWGVGPGTRVFQFAALIFDVSVSDMLMSLTRGACVCIPSEHERLNDMAGAIRRLSANYVSLTPSVASLLRPADVPQLRTLVLGGEAPTRENVRTWAPCLNLIICYGPAECSITCSGTDPATLSSDPSSVGQPLGCRMWIVDPADHDLLAPVGCVGEILVEGPILARGYLKDPEKTTAAFIEDPAFIKRFGSDGQSRRFYKTGDLGYYRPEFDGSMGFAGRKDTQVKVRGQRVELGEIEHHVYARPEVQHVVATVPSEGPLKNRLLSLLVMADDVVPQGNTNDDGNIAIQSGLSNQEAASFASNISDYLADRLPRYMIPAVFVFVKEIPLNTSGKLDRKQVQVWVDSMDDATYQLIAKATENESPESPLQPSEELLIHVCSNVLKLAPADIRLGQSFLSLGGDSITAMLVVSRCKSEGMVVSVKDILRSKTLHKLATLLTPVDLSSTQEQLNHKSPLPVVISQDNHETRLWRFAQEYLGHVDLSEIEAVYPCTPVQTGMLMTHARNSQYYQIKNVAEVKSTVSGVPVDIKLLEQAWRDVVDRQPTLRTAFFEIPLNNLFHQVVIKSHNNARIQRFDLAETDDENDLIQDFFTRRTIDYQAHAPASQFSIGVTSSGRVLVKMDMLHALSDGTTWGLIFRELCQAYGNKLFAEQAPAPLYSDYVSYLASQPTEITLEYWQKYLAGVRPCMFPTNQGVNKSEAAKPTTQIAFVYFHRGTELQSLCAKHGITISNLIQTVWGIILRSFVGCDDICFGYVVSGRDVPLPNLEQAIGTYIGQLPCRIQIQDTDSVMEVALKLQDGFFNGLAHQHMHMVDLYHSLPGITGQLFNTNVHYMRAPSPEMPEPPMIEIDLKHSNDTAEYDITVHATVIGNDVRFHLGYWDSAISKCEATHLADLLSRTLVTILEDVEKKIGSLSKLLGSTKSVSSDATLGISLPVKSQSSLDAIEEDPRQSQATKVNGVEKRSLSDREEALRQAWVDVLAVNADVVNHTTSLRSLGVDSYLAIQIVRRVQDLGFNLGFSDALSGMTLSGMAACLTPTTLTHTASELPPVTTALLSDIDSPAYDEDAGHCKPSNNNSTQSGSINGSGLKSSGLSRKPISTQPTTNKVPSGVLIELTPNNLPLATLIMKPDQQNPMREPAAEIRTTCVAPVTSFELAWEGVEDFLPATSVQQAMLESQKRLSAPNLYVPRAIWRVNGLTKAAGCETLVKSWQRIVTMHACLRTVFVRTEVSGICRYNQLVLRNVDARIQHFEAESESEALKLLMDHQPAATAFSHDQSLRPAHVLTVCHITGKDEHAVGGDEFIVDLSISHALSDAVSSAVVLRQLAAMCGSAACDSKASTVSLPSSAPYSDIQRSYDLRDIAHRNEGKEYWRSYLHGAVPCHFPTAMNISAASLSKVGKVSVCFERSSELRSYTMATGITASTFFRTAWAIILAKWLGTTEVCFGYVVSGRDVSVPGIEEIVGPVLNVLPCRVNIVDMNNGIMHQGTSEKKDAIVLELLLDKIQTDLLESLPHQLSSSTFVNNATYPESSMFNTLVNFRNSGLSRLSKTQKKTPVSHASNGTDSVFGTIEDFEVLWYEDPMDFDIILAVGEGKNNLEIDLNYWNGRISHETAHQVGEDLLRTLHAILDTFAGAED
ncbi:peptide synthetase [Fusarium heterosporum]|uniref:Peptide synthetase n=1 Tax=Fusarium heterosporum TaxID=42747 RepID=A0A8H5TYB7_FUSHE|nr:peptide synthetase [Fusarium heterosporum]